MFKKPSIQPMQPASPLRSRSGEAVDHIAAASGVPVLILAVTQLMAPSMATPLTGLGWERPVPYWRLNGLRWVDCCCSAA